MVAGFHHQGEACLLAPCGHQLSLHSSSGLAKALARVAQCSLEREHGGYILHGVKKAARTVFILPGPLAAFLEGKGGAAPTPVGEMFFCIFCVTVPDYTKRGGWKQMFLHSGWLARFDTVFTTQGKPHSLINQTQLFGTTPYSVGFLSMFHACSCLFSNTAVSPKT